MHHDLKLHQEHFRAKRNREKDWEIRKNDRDFKTGDTLIFHEVIRMHDPELAPEPTGDQIGPVQIIGPVVINAAGLQPGSCIFQHSISQR